MESVPAVFQTMSKESVLYAVMKQQGSKRPGCVLTFADALETIVSGVCLDTTYGFAMPEGDSIIIISMEYAIVSFAFWVYLYRKEKTIYNPFKKENLPRLLGSLTDNVGIVFYSYAMAIDSVSTDPLLALYPVLVMICGHAIMKERVSLKQHIYLLCIVAGSVMVIIDALM